MSAMPQHHVRLNTKRLAEVNAMLQEFRPQKPTDIGWHSLSSHTVMIRQERDLFGYRVWIADARGCYTRTITGDIIHDSEEAALSAARQKLNSMNLLETDA